MTRLERAGVWAIWAFACTPSILLLLGFLVVGMPSAPMSWLLVTLLALGTISGGMLIALKGHARLGVGMVSRCGRDDYGLPWGKVRDCLVGQRPPTCANEGAWAAVPGWMRSLSDAPPSLKGACFRAGPFDRGICWSDLVGATTLSAACLPTAAGEAGPAEREASGEEWMRVLHVLLLLERMRREAPQGEAGERAAGKAREEVMRVLLPMLRTMEDSVELRSRAAESDAIVRVERGKALALDILRHDPAEGMPEAAWWTEVRAPARSRAR